MPFRSSVSPIGRCSERDSRSRDGSVSPGLWLSAKRNNLAHHAPHRSFQHNSTLHTTSGVVVPQQQQATGKGRSPRIGASQVERSGARGTHTSTQFPKRRSPGTNRPRLTTATTTTSQQANNDRPRRAHIAVAAAAAYHRNQSISVALFGVFWLSFTLTTRGNGRWCVVLSFRHRRRTQAHAAVCTALRQG